MRTTSEDMRAPARRIPCWSGAVRMVESGRRIAVTIARTLASAAARSASSKGSGRAVGGFFLRVRRGILLGHAFLFMAFKIIL